MKIKLFVAREIKYFELGIFSFNSYVYYFTRGFSASTLVFNLPTRPFNLATRVFSLLTRAFELVTRGFELETRRFELITRGFELVTHGFELLTCGFELVTRNSCFTFPFNECVKIADLPNELVFADITLVYKRRDIKKKIIGLLIFYLSYLKYLKAIFMIKYTKTLAIYYQVTKFATVWVCLSIHYFQRLKDRRKKVITLLYL